MGNLTLSNNFFRDFFEKSAADFTAGCSLVTYIFRIFSRKSLKGAKDATSLVKHHTASVSSHDKGGAGLKCFLANHPWIGINGLQDVLAYHHARIGYEPITTLNVK